MAKSVFVTDLKEIMRHKSIRELVLHLHDPERWPMDLEAHLEKLKGRGMVLATAVVASHAQKNPEFRRCAEMLASMR